MNCSQRGDKSTRLRNTSRVGTVRSSFVMHFRLAVVASSALLLCALAFFAPVGVASAKPSPSFSFAQKQVSRSTIPASSNYDAPSGVAEATCQWPDGKMSITVRQAASVLCLPPKIGKFPIPAPGSFALLDTPIGGVLYPPQNGGLSDDIRFVHLAKSGGVIDVGPPILQFGDYSGGARPSMLEENGSLWIFDYWTERGPEVVRISTTTGSILQRTTMPAFSRPIIALNPSGFWLAGGSDSLRGSPAPVPGIWLAPIGASKGMIIKKSSSGVALRMVAEGSAMQVYFAPVSAFSPGPVDLWTFTPKNG